MLLDLHSTSADIRGAASGVAVFPIGAIEQHSGHLPLGTDWFLVMEVSRRVALELGALLLPALPFSMSQCHGTAAGTVWLRPETLAAAVRDVVHSLRAQGIHKVVVINGHGGNFVLWPVIREVNLTYPDTMVVMPSFEGGLGAAGLFESGDLETHAGEIETSLQLALRPELVKGEGVDDVPSVGREYLDYVPMDVISASGVMGVPSLASAEKGERAFALVAKHMAEVVRETFASLDLLRSAGNPEDELG